MQSAISLPYFAVALHFAVFPCNALAEGVTHDVVVAVVAVVVVVVVVVVVAAVVVLDSLD